MTAQKKNYTNADIIKRLDRLDDRMGAMETWKIAQDAGKAAVDEYRRQETSDKINKGKEGVYGIIKDAGPYILIILAAIAVISYAYASRAK